MAQAGAGEVVLPQTDKSGKKKYVDPAGLRETAARVLSDPAYKQRAVEISEKLKTYGGAKQAADVVEGMG